MEFTDDRIVIDRPRTVLDELVIGVTDVFEEVGVDYALVAGYVAILFGRSRATEDIDVIIEALSEDRTRALANELSSAGYWGAAMPLEEMYETLTDGLNIRIAEDGRRVPNVEVKFPQNTFDRYSLEHTVPVDLGDETIRIGELELQIAYKLRLGTRKDFEDAIHLYIVAEETLSEHRLEEHVENLGVEAEYDELKRT